MRGNRKITDVLSVLLAALFCWHVSSITLFPHFHEINGVVICHSHPFSGSADNPGHSHTSIQLDTIAQLSLLLLVISAMVGIACLMRITGSVAGGFIQGIPVIRPETVPCLRGPPHC